MRTTLREKAVLWVNGLTIAVGLELIMRGQVDPLSPGGAALLAPTLLALTCFTGYMLRR
jgi:hypothetical protein